MQNELLPCPVKLIKKYLQLQGLYQEPHVPFQFPLPHHNSHHQTQKFQAPMWPEELERKNTPFLATNNPPH